MASADIRHIVFDIGKVLIHYDPNLPYARIIPDAQERAWFFANVCTHDWNIEQDRGRTWEEAEALLIADHPSAKTRSAPSAATGTKWCPCYEESVALMLGFIEEGRDVTMLTNFAADTFRQAQEIFPFLKAPRGVTVSGEIGLIKPDREIYETHVKSFGLDPRSYAVHRRCAGQCRGAKAAGWHAVLFKDPATLRTDLATYGLLAPEEMPLA